MQNTIKRLELIKNSIELGDSDEFIKQQLLKLENEHIDDELKQIIEKFGQVDLSTFVDSIDKYSINAKKFQVLENKYQNLLLVKKEYVEKITSFNKQCIDKLSNVIDKRLKNNISEYQKTLKIFEDELENAKKTYRAMQEEWDILRSRRSEIENIIKKVDDFSNEYDMTYTHLSETGRLINTQQMRLEEQRIHVKSKIDRYENHHLRKKLEEFIDDSNKFNSLCSSNSETIVQEQHILATIDHSISLSKKCEVFEEDIADLKLEIDEIKNNKDFIYIENINNLDTYLNNMKNDLDDTWIDRLWKWADENDIPDLQSTFYGGFYDVLSPSMDGIPRNKYDLKSLKQLNIAGYDLKSIPKEIGKLIHLKSLYLGTEYEYDEAPEWIGNNLDSLPNEIKNLKNLTRLSLSTNNFIFLPKEICLLKNLEHLYVDGNSLIELPPEIGNLVNLIDLDISYNNLTTLPLEICNLTKLTSLRLIAGEKKIVLTDSHKAWIEKLKINHCHISGEDEIIWKSDIPIIDIPLTIKNKQNTPVEIYGNWKKGWALALHTLKSVPLGNGKFDTTYTEIGKALNELKYHQNYKMIDVLANKVVAFLNTSNLNIDVIIPTPPSKIRPIQPVVAIAEKVSELVNIPIDSDYIVKNKNTSELKSIEDASEREKILLGAFDLRDLSYENKNILLLDDLYRSGTTLKEITKTIYASGKVKNVYVITLTQTRSKR